MKYPRVRVIVMSKAPDPGQVKTRLVPLLGVEAAAQLYRTLLENTLDMLARAALCPVELCCAPDAEHDFFRHCRDHYDIELTGQVDGDLGRRMSHAVAVALQHSDGVVLIGADCPSLTVADIDTALHALVSGMDVVIGPAADGGYFLIAMHTHHAGLFDDIPWGGSDVLAVTGQRLDSLGLTCHRLTTRADLDTPTDYQTWRTAVESAFTAGGGQ
jgi:rSAM/selenodomain-associated transferase 1